MRPKPAATTRVRHAPRGGEEPEMRGAHGTPEGAGVNRRARSVGAVSWGSCSTRLRRWGVRNALPEPAHGATRTVLIVVWAARAADASVRECCNAGWYRSRGDGDLSLELLPPDGIVSKRTQALGAEASPIGQRAVVVGATCRLARVYRPAHATTVGRRRRRSGGTLHGPHRSHLALPRARTVAARRGALRPPAGRARQQAGRKPDQQPPRELIHYVCSCSGSATFDQT